VKQLPYSILLFLLLFTPIFAIADIARSPLSPGSSQFPFIIGGIALIGIGIFVVIMVRRKKNK
jgi:hypothetical protein